MHWYSLCGKQSAPQKAKHRVICDPEVLLLGLCMHAHLLSCVQPFAIPWSVVCQSSLFMEFSRQDYWSQMPFPTLGGSSRSRNQTYISCASCIGRQILYFCATWASPLLGVCAQSHSTLCDPPVDCSLPGSSVHGDSPGKNSGVGCHSLLQGIFPTQGLNPGLPHCRQILYQLIHQEAYSWVYNPSPDRYIHPHKSLYTGVHRE